MLFICCTTLERHSPCITTQLAVVLLAAHYADLTALG